jgi:hypothetical protein
MQCAHCGFAQPGDAASCPGCGRGFAKAAPPVPKPSPPLICPATIRFVGCVAVIFALARGFGALCDKYVSAENERLESELVGQGLDHRRRIQEIEREVDGQ